MRNMNLVIWLSGYLVIDCGIAGLSKVDEDVLEDL
jgi:hypothetical protein